MKCRLFVAAILIGIAATSLAGVAIANPVEVRGIPVWLHPVAERGITAIWAKIPRSYDGPTREGLLITVASRLFGGYSVGEVRSEGPDGRVSVNLVPCEPCRPMIVRILPPSLSPPLDGWFAKDVEGIAEEITAMIAGVPLDALGWGGEALRSAVSELFGECLPGWEPSLMVRNSGGEPVIEIRLTPGEPFVLAVEPHLDSSSLPVTLIRTDIQEDIFVLTQKVAGVPVPWLEKHREDFERWVASDLSGRQLAEKACATVRVDLSPARITKARVNLESRRYVIWGWIAAYAGTEDRYPEMGLHLGRRVQPWSGWDAEIYGEGILRLEDFTLENRWGLRWSPMESVWIGAERVFPDDKWWGRLSFEAGPRNTYTWWRFSEDEDSNFGLGYRLNEFISLELHYDDRDDDEWSIKALGNL